MSLLDRVRECTQHDPTRFVPFLVEGRRAGRVRRDRLALLAELSGDTLQVSDAAVHLAPELSDFDARTSAMADVVAGLADRGLVPAWAHELFSVAPGFGAPAWFALERAALPLFGIPAYGVHLHGIVLREDGPWLWIARRSRGRHTYPGQLDNMVAAGQPHGLSVADNLVKECAEEAGLDEALARTATPTGAVSYTLDVERGLRDDTLFLYELVLPEDFTPRNTDGEVESFELMPARDVLRLVAETQSFKFNCNLTSSSGTDSYDPTRRTTSPSCANCTEADGGQRSGGRRQRTGLGAPTTTA
mgnify:CR=1 FL=1